MAKTFEKHPYECSFYYPHDATLPTATASVTIKAPERGDRRAKARNQTFARLKSGNVVVYDMGTNMSDILSLSFEMVPQSEWAALIVFFDYVVWGGNKIKYRDYKGDEYVVRVYKNSVETVNRGEADMKSSELTQYDFTLDLIDVTNNVTDTGQTAVPTQLALHLADSNHPHNPKTSVTLTTATPTIVESVSVPTCKHVTWLVSLVDGTFSKTVAVHATHNGTAVSDATTVGTTQETLATTGTDPANITLAVELSSTGIDQIMSLMFSRTIGTTDISVRRLRL
jgi:hypothetical protein